MREIIHLSEHMERMRQFLWVSAHTKTYTQTQTGDLGHSSMRLSYGWWMKPTHPWKTEQDHYDLGCKHTGESQRGEERNGKETWADAPYIWRCVWSLKPHMAHYCYWITIQKGLDWTCIKRFISTHWIVCASVMAMRCNHIIIIIWHVCMQSLL